jgi:hypothetical protein
MSAVKVWLKICVPNSVEDHLVFSNYSYAMREFMILTQGLLFEVLVSDGCLLECDAV